MNLRWTEKELQKIEMTAVQKVLQERFIKAVEARAEEINNQINSMTCEDLTAEQVIEDYLGSQIAVPQRALLIPH